MSNKMIAEMTIYGYDNFPVGIELPKKEIEQIVVRILSGDETAEVWFSDGEKAYYDAGICRFVTYLDKEYTVPKELVNEWLEWIPLESSYTYVDDRAEWFTERLEVMKDGTND